MSKSSLLIWKKIIVYGLQTLITAYNQFKLLKKSNYLVLILSVYLFEIIQ